MSVRPTSAVATFRFPASKKYARSNAKKAMKESIVIHFSSRFLFLPRYEASSREQMLPIIPAAVNTRPSSRVSFTSQRSDMKVRRLEMSAEPLIKFI